MALIVLFACVLVVTGVYFATQRQTTVANDQIVDSDMQGTKHGDAVKGTDTQIKSTVSPDNNPIVSGAQVDRTAQAVDTGVPVEVASISVVKTDTENVKSIETTIQVDVIDSFDVIKGIKTALSAPYVAPTPDIQSAVDEITTIWAKRIEFLNTAIRSTPKPFTIMDSVTRTPIFVIAASENAITADAGTSQYEMKWKQIPDAEVNKLWQQASVYTCDNPSYIRVCITAHVICGDYVSGRILVKNSKLSSDEKSASIAHIQLLENAVFGALSRRLTQGVGDAEFMASARRNMAMIAGFPGNDWAKQAMREIPSDNVVVKSTESPAPVPTKQSSPGTNTSSPVDIAGTLTNTQGVGQYLPVKEGLQCSGRGVLRGDIGNGVTSIAIKMLPKRSSGRLLITSGTMSTTVDLERSCLLHQGSGTAVPISIMPRSTNVMSFTKIGKSMAVVINSDEPIMIPGGVRIGSAITIEQSENADIVYMTITTEAK